MTISAIIVEDNVDYVHILKTYLKYYPEIYIVATTEDKKEACAKILHFEPDLVFMDISLSDGTGFDVLDVCEGSYKYVIFTTAYGEFALKAYNYSAVHYLLKPYKKEVLDIAIDKLKVCLNMSNKKSVINQSKLGNTKSTQEIIFVLDGNKYVPIHINEIIYIQADTSYCIIHSVNKKIKVSKPLKALLEHIEHHTDIIRIHKSYAINLKHVSCIKRGLSSTVHLTNDVVLPISNSEREDIYIALGIKK